MFEGNIQQGVLHRIFIRNYRFADALEPVKWNMLSRTVL